MAKHYTLKPVTIRSSPTGDNFFFLLLNLSMPILPFLVTLYLNVKNSTRRKQFAKTNIRIAEYQRFDSAKQSCRDYNNLIPNRLKSFPGSGRFPSMKISIMQLHHMILLSSGVEFACTVQNFLCPSQVSSR